MKTTPLALLLCLLVLGGVFATVTAVADPKPLNVNLPLVLHAPTIALAVPPLPLSPLAFSSVDAAGIAGVDGLPAEGFIHLEDPAVCGAACRVPGTQFGDESSVGWCPAAGQPNWQWRWSSGVASQGVAGCTLASQATAFVHANGFIGVQSPACSGSICYSPVNVPSSGNPNGAVFGLWTDLDNSCTTGTNGFYTAIGGTAPNRYWIWEWWNVPRYPCATTGGNPQQFEIILFESTNEVQVYYGATMNPGQSVSGGEENNNGLTGLQYFRGATGVQPPQNTGILYYDATPPAVTAITVTCQVPGSSGWCRSTSNTVTVTDNNDLAPGGRIGFGVKSRVRSIDSGPSLAYTSGTGAAVSAADGTHSIQATVTDWGLNVATGTGTLKVDATPPVVAASATCGNPGNDGWCRGPVSLSGSATDATSGVAGVACTLDAVAVPCSSSTGAQGLHSFVVTATDVAGNTASQTVPFRIDDVAPVTTAGLAGDEGAGGWFVSPVTVTLQPTDATSGVASTDYRIDGGEPTPYVDPFEVAGDALHALEVGSADQAGNLESASIVLVPIDTTPPVLEAGHVVAAEATSASGAEVAYALPAASDATSGLASVVCDPAAATLFALGDTTVECTATDNAGHATAGSFVLRVQDTTPPTIAPHAGVFMEAESEDGALVEYEAPATSDLVDGDGVADCTPASGTVFPIGNTLVTCTATDAAGNTATSTFLVHIGDSTPPVIQAHEDLVVEATSAAGALVSYNPPATHDDVDGVGVADCEPAPGSLFALGVTLVTCTATDVDGNDAEPVAFTVTVVDTTAPLIAAVPDLVVTATGPDGAVVDYDLPVTTDAVDGDGVAECLPASGSLFAVGKTAVVCTATDAAGNVADAVTFAVNVELGVLDIALAMPKSTSQVAALQNGIPIQVRAAFAGGAPAAGAEVVVTVTNVLHDRLPVPRLVATFEAAATDANGETTLVLDLSNAPTFLLAGHYRVHVDVAVGGWAGSGDGAYRVTIV